MRRMAFTPVVVVIVLSTFALCLGILTISFGLRHVEVGEFHGVVYFLSCLFFTYAYAILAYRVFFWFFPLPVGELQPGTREEFIAKVHFMFFLMLFNSLILTHVIPIPLMRWVYRALGARMGRNSYSAGNLLDPLLIAMGDHCIVGHNAVIYCHIIEGNRLGLSPVTLGNRVTVGTLAVIMPGVTIGDGAIVSAGAVVVKDTRIGAGEIWGGVPAHRLK